MPPTFSPGTAPGLWKAFYFLLAPGIELSDAGCIPVPVRLGAALPFGLVAPGIELSAAGAPVVPFCIEPFCIVVGAAALGAEFG